VTSRSSRMRAHKQKLALCHLLVDVSLSCNSIKFQISAEVSSSRGLNSKFTGSWMNCHLARSSTGTVFVRVNGRPSTADQVVRYLTSSTAAELHPTQCRKRSARHGGDITYLAYPTVAYSHVRGLRTNTYDWSHFNGIRPSLNRVRSHSAEYVVCSRRVAMP
jgi:hypothetical protein